MISILTDCYSFHQKKVYTCGKAEYSKSRRTRGKVFCKLLSRPFDKIKMTRGQGQ